MTDRPIVDVVAELLTIEARMEGLGRRGAQLRADLEARAREAKARDGVAPTWRASGLGTASYSDPQPKVTVKDRAAFASWLGQRHPENVDASITVFAAGPDVLERALAALAENDVPVGPVELAIRPAFEKQFLAGCAAVDDPPTDEVFAPESGERVDGLHLAPAAPGRLSVRLNPEAKARATAEAAVAAGILSAPLGELGRAVTPASAAALRTEHAAATEVEEADGEPDYDDPADPDAVASSPMQHTEAQVFGLASGATLEELTVPVLQALCADRGLSRGGKKQRLIERLRAAENVAVPA